MAYTDRFPIVNNFLETRLSADCDKGEKTLYIESVDALPRIIVGRDYIPLVLRDAGSVREIVYVDSVDADSGAVIVRRGQEGTNATAWSAGSYAYCTVTADSFQRMRVNGFAPLVDGTSGRPEFLVTSSTTVSIAGDYTAQVEVGMAVRVLAGDSVVEPTDATLGAIHISSVEYTSGVTTLVFQNVTLPKNVSGLDLGLSTSAAPMYHPETIVADNITTSQEGNVISADLALQAALQASEKQVSVLSADLRALIAEEVAAQNQAIAGKAPVSHASAGATYGVGTGGMYGHVKLSDYASSDGVVDGVAATPLAVRKILPAGSVIAFAGNPSSAPEGFLLCNGAAVSRTTYASLFAVIGTTYGAGNGSNTFGLPNLTDKFIQGSGTAGTEKSAGLPEISGNHGRSASTFATGPFFFDDEGALGGGLTGSGGTARIIGFKASQANKIYGSSTTVQPPALTMRYYIKY